MPYVEYDEVEAVCSDCGRAFRSEEALAEHRDEAHSGAVDPTERRGASTGVVCSVCRQRFSSTSALERHNRRAHTG